MRLWQKKKKTRTLFSAMDPMGISLMKKKINWEISNNLCTQLGKHKIKLHWRLCSLLTKFAVSYYGTGDNTLWESASVVSMETQRTIGSI